MFDEDGACLRCRAAWCGVVWRVGRVVVVSQRVRLSQLAGGVWIPPLRVCVLSGAGDGCLATDECVEVLRSRATRALDKVRRDGCRDAAPVRESDVSLLPHLVSPLLRSAATWASWT